MEIRAERCPKWGLEGAYHLKAEREMAGTLPHYGWGMSQVGHCVAQAVLKNFVPSPGRTRPRFSDGIGSVNRGGQGGKNFPLPESGRLWKWL